MRAFLSHSSKDKAFVGSVSDILRPGTFELDSLTFDAGLVNSAAIIQALNRCDLFCLFLSKNSVRSSYVQFETLLGIEFIARGGIRKFLAICLDEESFSEASADVRFFNVVRKSLSPDSAARLIQGELVSAATVGALQAHPFIGREEELIALEKQITDHERPLSKAIFISGNFGSGRRTTARHFYRNQYPAVGKIFPEVDIAEFFGLEEIYRKLIITLRPATKPAEFLTRAKAFAIASDDEKRRLIAQLLNSLLPASEAAFLIDTGGVLTDSGALETELNEIISYLDARPHPPITIIAPRMIPFKLRRSQDDISYLALKSLTRDVGKRLVSRLLRDHGISADGDEIERLVTLADGHPFNFYRMIDEVSSRGVEAFLANPTDFIDWKHRQSSEYLQKIPLSDGAVLILGLLKLVPELDFTAVTAALQIDPAVASETLLQLADLHVVEAKFGRFVISPALRIAVERDRRIGLPAEVRKTAVTALANTLSIRIEEGTAPIALVDAAILSSLEGNEGLPNFASAFLLPSHYVWLSKRNYDERFFPESIRLAKEALSGVQRLSSAGFVAACRYMCLAAARTGNSDVFQEGIEKLEKAANNEWAQSNVAFLKGFNFRLKGKIPAAEAQFKEAYRLSPGNLSAAREIAAICLIRDQLDEAETFAREAYSHASRNPYLVDMLISVLIRKRGRRSASDGEIRELFDVLEEVGEEAGRSLFTTRKAEFEHLWGDNKEALSLVEKAISKTPTIFEPRRLLAEIYLKDGNNVKAAEAINWMREKVNSRDPDERRSNYRSYLVTYSRYLQSIGQYAEAKEVYDDQNHLSRLLRW